MPSAAGSDRSARPPSQSPLSSRTARAASRSTWVRASALARMSSADQSGFCAASLSRFAARSGFGSSDGSFDHQRDERVGDRRRIEEDERRRPDPVDRQRRRGHPAPAVADDLDLGHVQAGRPDPGGEVGGVVAEAVVALPVPGQAVPGLSTATTRRPVAASAGPTRHQIRAEAVIAVDQHERSVGRDRPRRATRTGSRPRSSSTRVSSAGSALLRARRRRPAAGRPAVATIAAGEVAGHRRRTGRSMHGFVRGRPSRR